MTSVRMENTTQNKEEFKAKREKLGLTQKSLAELLDVKENTVYRWERGILPLPRMAVLALESIERRVTS